MTTTPANLKELRRRIAEALAEERRDCQRSQGPGEVLVMWHHDPLHDQRYSLLDLSEHGLRVRSSARLPEGMTGRVTLALDDGTRFSRAAMVAWCRASRNDDGATTHFEAGIRLFDGRMGAYGPAEDAA